MSEENIDTIGVYGAPQQSQETIDTIGVHGSSEHQGQTIDTIGLSSQVKPPSEFHPLGNIEYGGAETGSLLFRGINRNTSPSSTLEEYAQSLDAFRRRHPEYAPEEVENTLDLLSNPRALSSRVLGSAAYTGLMIGTSAIPAVGPMITGLTAYGIESQRGYEDAKSFGATDQEAETAAKHIGTANAIAQMFMNSRMLNVVKGEEGALARSMSESSRSWVRALGPAADLTKDAGVLGSLGAIQGAVDDKIALDTYGRPEDKGFWDKRLQEFATGAAATVMFGVAGRSVKRVIFGKGENPQPIGEAEINVVDRDSAFRFFKESGAPDDTAKSMAAISDSAASQWAMDTGLPKEQWFVQSINDKNFHLQTNGNAIQSNIESVFKSFDTDPAVALKTFTKQVIGNLPQEKLDAFKTSLKIIDTTPSLEADAKMDSAFMRYLWEGESPAPELVAPLEDMKHLLRDTYKNVSTLGAKVISPETKVIFDSMLAPETDQIKSVREKANSIRKQIEAGFPEGSKPTIPDELLQSLSEPIRETITHLEEDISSDFPKQVTETIVRSRTREEMAKAIEDHLASQTQPDNGLKTASVEGLERTRAESEILLQDQISELDRLRMGRLIPSEMSGVEARSESGGWLRDQYLNESPSERRQSFGFVSRVKDNLATLESYVQDQRAALKRWTSGEKFIEAGTEVETLSRMTQGRYNAGVKKSFTDLTWRERQWLQLRDKDGFTNLEKIVDQTIVADLKEGSTVVKNPRAIEVPDKFTNVENLRNFLWSVNKDMARQATRQGTLMRFSDGKHMPFRQPEMQRFLRLHTDDFRQMMKNPSSQGAQAFFETVRGLNPELEKMSLDQIAKLADKVFNDSEIRTNSSLEAARLFKIVPSEIMVGGKRVQIFETDPLRYAQRAVKIQADRLAWGKVMGQQQIDTVGRRMTKRICDALGVSPKDDKAALIQRMRERVLKADPQKLQDRLDANATKGDKNGPANSAETAINSVLSNLRNSTLGERAQAKPETTTEMTNPRDNLMDRKALADAIKVARDLGIDLKPSKQDYLDNLSTLTATNMDAKQLAKLPGLAKQLEGIDISLPSHVLLSEIKSRLNEDVFNHVEELKNRVVAESGGVAKSAFEDVLRQMQGIPMKGDSTRALPSIVQSLQNIGGTMMTSLRAPLHVPQTLWQVGGKYGLGGVYDYIAAMGDVIKDYGPGRRAEALKIIGAVPDVVNSWGFEKILSTEFLGRLAKGDVSISKGLESFTGNVRQAWNKLGLINAIMDFNNTVAGEAGRRFADGLKNRSIVDGQIKTKLGLSLGRTEIAHLKDTGVSSHEIDQIKAGQMSDVTYAKIVQGSVQLLGTDLPSWKKGKIENSPIARMIVPFAGYAINNGRIVAGYFRNNLMPALKSKDPVAILGSIKDLSIFVGSAMGAGAVTQVLVNIPRGAEMKETLKHEDDSVIEAGMGALMKIGFMGPAARFVESVEYGGGDQMLVGMMPYLKQVENLLGLLYNQGLKLTTGKSTNERYSQFGFGDNATEYAKSMNPAARSILHWLDNAAYPEKVGYDEARAAAQLYKHKHSKTESTPTGDALNPATEKVLFFVQRNDSKGAFQAAQQYYRDYVDQMMKDPRQSIVDGMSPMRAGESLRSSLLSRAPLDMTENEKLDFLSKLPKDRLVKYYKSDLKFRSIVDGVAPSQK